MLPSKFGEIQATMNSREIAELTGKEHKNVLADIRSMFNDLGMTSAEFSANLPDIYGRPQVAFRLPKRETLILVSGYSAAMRARIIDRWQELEAGETPKVPTTLSGALRLAAEQAEEIERQTQLIEQQRPAVEFVGKYVKAEGNKGLREVAKLLKANERQFVKWLQESKIMYMLGGHLTPMAQHLDAGRFEVKAGVSGAGHAFNQAKFTPKGVEWIAGEWGKHNARLQA